MAWRSWTIFLLLGLIVWFVAAPPLEAPKSEFNPGGWVMAPPSPDGLVFERSPAPPPPPKKKVYDEAKEWAAVIGQIMSGFAGAGMFLKTGRGIWAKIIRRK